MSANWDAKTYDRVSNPQLEMAQPVLERYQDRETQDR